MVDFFGTKIPERIENHEIWNKSIEEIIMRIRKIQNFFQAINKCLLIHFNFIKKFKPF